MIGISDRRPEYITLHYMTAGYSRHEWHEPTSLIPSTVDYAVWASPDRNFLYYHSDVRLLPAAVC